MGLGPGWRKGACFPLGAGDSVFIGTEKSKLPLLSSQLLLQGPPHPQAWGSRTGSHMEKRSTRWTSAGFREGFHPPRPSWSREGEEEGAWHVLMQGAMGERLCW